LWWLHINHNAILHYTQRNNAKVHYKGLWRFIFASLDVQVVLSSYTAPSRFYPPFLWIINMWCPYRLWQTLYSVHPAAVAPLPCPEPPENAVASLDRTAYPEKMSSEGISVIGVFAVGHRRGLGHN
jgi:hypothetical protein